MKDELDGRSCGKHGCNRPAAAKIYGDLTYYACKKHRAEIEALTAREG